MVYEIKVLAAKSGEGSLQDCGPPIPRVEVGTAGRRVWDVAEWRFLVGGRNCQAGRGQSLSPGQCLVSNVSWRIPKCAHIFPLPDSVFSSMLRISNPTIREN